MFIEDEMSFFCPHAPKALRTARRTTGGWALPAAGVIRMLLKTEDKIINVFTKTT